MNTKILYLISVLTICSFFSSCFKKAQKPIEEVTAKSDSRIIDKEKQEPEADIDSNTPDETFKGLSEEERNKRDTKAINKVKRLSVSELDKKLTETPFEEWFSKVVGQKVSKSWEVNDCGEQTGDGEGRDFPICVDVSAVENDSFSVSVLVAVGTHKKGVVGKPEVFWIYLKKGDSIM